jgi:hypothetical protein
MRANCVIRVTWLYMARLGNQKLGSCKLVLEVLTWVGGKSFDRF